MLLCEKVRKGHSVNQRPDKSQAVSKRLSTRAVCTDMIAFSALYDRNLMLHWCQTEQIFMGKLMIGLNETSVLSHRLCAKRKTDLLDTSRRGFIEL